MLYFGLPSFQNCEKEMMLVKSPSPVFLNQPRWFYTWPRHQCSMIFIFMFCIWNLAIYYYSVVIVRLSKPPLCNDLRLLLWSLCRDGYSDAFLVNLPASGFLFYKVEIQWHLYSRVVLLCYVAIYKAPGTWRILLFFCCSLWVPPQDGTFLGVLFLLLIEVILLFLH